VALFTFGYEGLPIQAFITRLRTAGVRTVLDVRELPLSRKPGFSKRAFAEALRQSGILYVHLPALGCPRPVRERYKADGNWSVYAKAFTIYLADQRQAVAELVQIANKTSACLVCFEADFNRCHRSIVAKAAKSAGGPIVAHLAAARAIPEGPVRAVA
jgi:uncharacterized protein (DUF488 family)